jgi:hypothetical protein
MIETMQTIAALPLGLPATGIVSFDPAFGNAPLLAILLAAVLILARQTHLRG